MIQISAGYFYPPVGIIIFSADIFFLCKKCDSPNFSKTLFISEFFKTFNIYNKHQELYISMTGILQLFIVREIKLSKVKYKKSL